MSELAKIICIRCREYLPDDHINCPDCIGKPLKERREEDKPVVFVQFDEVDDVELSKLSITDQQLIKELIDREEL